MLSVIILVFYARALYMVRGEQTEIKELLFMRKSGYIASLPSHMNFTQRRINVPNELKCVFRCTKEKWCKSANFKHFSENQGNGQHMCELLSTGADVDSEYLKENYKFVYLSVKELTYNPCKKQPCLNEGICVKVNHRERYECRCVQEHFGENCEKECDGMESALGMESRAIPDSAITASSKYAEKSAAPNARLNSDPEHWAATFPPRHGEWLQVDFGNLTLVTKVATQGRPILSPNYVTSYSISYRLENESWQSYVHVPRGDVLSANTDQNGIVTNTLTPNILTRYIRIYPKTWFDAITMRVEFYGCHIS